MYICMYVYIYYVYMYVCMATHHALWHMMDGFNKLHYKFLLLIGHTLQLLT